MPKSVEDVWFILNMPLCGRPARVWERTVGEGDRHLILDDSSDFRSNMHHILGATRYIVQYVIWKWKWWNVNQVRAYGSRYARACPRKIDDLIQLPRNPSPTAPIPPHKLNAYEKALRNAYIVRTSRPADRVCCKRQRTPPKYDVGHVSTQS
jgi:hypothetical protein